MIQPAFTVTQALEWRRAIPFFDTSVEISLDELTSLLETANLAPSSINMQPWEYLVVTSSEDKARLRKVAMNQAKVEDASAVVVVLGNLRQFEHAERLANSSIASGSLTEERKQGFLDMVHNATATPGAARDEAFRGSSLWSMAFMLVAAEAGWDTAPMGGYWPDKLVEEFGIPEGYIPTMIICVGRRDGTKTLRPRGERIPATELLHVSQFGKK